MLAISKPFIKLDTGPVQSLFDPSRIFEFTDNNDGSIGFFMGLNLEIPFSRNSPHKLTYCCRCYVDYIHESFIPGEIIVKTI